MATITTGRALADRDAIGGIKAVYIITDASDVVQLLDDSNCTRTANVVSSVPASLEAYKIDILRGAGGITQAVEGSMENGTYSYNMSLEFTLHKITSGTQTLIDALTKTRSTIGVLDNNDNVILMGYGNGMEMTGGSFQTGTGYGELNGATITMEGKEVFPAPFITATAGSGTAGYPFDAITNPITINADQDAP